MLINIPDHIVQMAIEGGIVTTKGNTSNMEGRMQYVERIEHHFSEIVMGIIIKQANKTLKLTYQQ